MKNTSILMNKIMRIFEVASAVRPENSQNFGLKRDLFFTFCLSRTEVFNKKLSFACLNITFKSLTLPRS
ncbi:MAG: hypothetical protein C5B43_04675 [Verrucomicrobia bacterium]|nr:MAG: hypothetical protein C5B43_04675 [Verrucomicrobiota bacterium]